MPQIGREEACMKCPGFCCYLMFLGMDKENMKKAYKANLVDVRRLTKKFYGSAEPSAEDVHALVVATQDLEMTKFGVEHFQLVEGVVNDEGKALEDIGGWRRQYAYRCDQFDVETGQCTCYENRPWTCKSFVCEPCIKGETPERKHFAYNKQLTEKQIAVINKNQ